MIDGFFHSGIPTLPLPPDRASPPSPYSYRNPCRRMMPRQSGASRLHSWKFNCSVVKFTPETVELQSLGPLRTRYQWGYKNLEGRCGLFQCPHRNLEGHCARLQRIAENWGAVATRCSEALSFGDILLEFWVWWEESWSLRWSNGCVPPPLAGDSSRFGNFNIFQPSHYNLVPRTFA